MHYRHSRDTFVRSIGNFGYIYSQLNKRDRVYAEGRGAECSCPNSKGHRRSAAGHVGKR